MNQHIECAKLGEESNLGKKQPIKKETIIQPRVVGGLQNKQGNKRKLSQVKANTATSETVSKMDT
jgi:hypothetical protein